jgi:transglutaminase-like putative cysteine protease
VCALRGRARARRQGLAAALAHPAVEPDADAEALLWEVRVDDQLDPTGVLSIRDHFFRVKVFTEKGAQEWTQHEVDYPKKGVSISDLAARTLRANGAVLTMDKKAISNETLVKTKDGQLKRISFALPGVEPGCIIEYRYREYLRNDDVYASTYPFQLEIPVQKVVYRIRPLEYPGLYMRQLTFHVQTQESPREKGYYVTSALNLPAFTSEPDMPPEYQVKAFMVLFYTDSPQGTAETYWPEVGRARAETFDKETKGDDRIRGTARTVTAGAAGERDKLERIARWVRSEFRVVRYASEDSLKSLGLREPKDVSDAVRQKGGYYRDAELVFAALCRAAGLDVRWVRVPSRSGIFFNPNMLHEGYLNSYQVAVKLDGQWTTFDPVTQYLAWDMRPWDEEATIGLLCDRDSSRFIETGYSVADHSVFRRSADLTLAPDGTLAGSVQVSWSGHLNATMRERLGDVAAEDLDSVVTETQVEGGTAVKFMQVAIARGDDESAPLGLTAQVELPGFASVTGKRILLEPAVFYAHRPPRYTSTTRRNPVYFRYPWTELDTVRVHLPAGWKVENAESGEPLSAEGVSDYAAGVMVSDDQTQVLYVRRFRMGIDGSIYFPVDSYPAVRQLFTAVQQRDRIALTLTRADTKP